jgi:hypothetical protein
MPFHSFTAEDDNFHAPTPGEPWFTETAWFSFNVPERRMGCWLYAWVRQNMNNAGGGVFVWDDSATEPWNLPYFKYQYTQPLPATRNLNDFTFPENYTIRMIEPLMEYALSYRDRDLIDLDLNFRGLFPPHGFASGEPPFHAQPHLDQMGHVTGTMVLNGERMAIDSYSIRDRSWGPRLDHRGNRIGYPFACAKDFAFCLFAVPNRDFSDREERINHGFYWANGEKHQLVSGVRHVERDPRGGWPTRMVVEAKDSAGRTLHAIGEVESRFVLNVPRGLCINSSIRWDVNGRLAYGEDQDVWRLDQWRAGRIARGEL